MFVFTFRKTQELSGVALHNVRNSQKLMEYPSVFVRESLINCLCGRIATLRGARNLNIVLYMPRFLRSVRLALHPAQAINQRFHRLCKFAPIWYVFELNEFDFALVTSLTRRFIRHRKKVKNCSLSKTLYVHDSFIVTAQKNIKNISRFLALL